MRIEMLRAAKGDCLLIHGGTEAEPALILVDGGPGGTYEDSLRPRLMELRDERGLGDGDPLVIDVVIVSHVDDDHINGVIDLFAEMHEAALQARPRLFEVKALWHNSFDDVLGNDEVKAAAAQFGRASFAPMAADAVDQTQWDAAMLLAGIDQGQKLRDLAAALDIEPNADFPEALIQVPDAGRLTSTVGGILFTVIAPRTEELAALQKKHDQWLRKRRERGRPVTPSSFLQALTDTSVANLSSIVLLAEHDGRTILLTGDARSDYLLLGLDKTGLPAADGTLDVEILKMPHHGSDRNVDGDFFRRVRADTYLFSGDGEHGNPERQTVEMLLEARPETPMTLMFTYPLAIVDAQRAREHTGAPWSDAKHALSALLVPAPAAVAVVEGTEAGVRL